MLKFVILLTALAVCNGQLTRYLLYSVANPTERVIPNTGTLATTDDFNIDHDTIILIHGHQGAASDPFNILIRGEIRTFRQHNVIVVDWKDVASSTYASASARVSVVADEVTTFISGLTDPGADVIADVKKMHLVGFGLGAHVAGIASRRLGDNRVGRITGLDPAGSGWGTNSGHLTGDDAVYVEVIHTDGSGLLNYGIGTAIGQVNFYANGGSNQPGCLSHSCSHNRAYELFASSLSNRNLVGYPCSTMTQMNLNRCRGDALLVGDTEIDKTGVTSFSVYRINTRRSWPF